MPQRSPDISGLRGAFSQLGQSNALLEQRREKKRAKRRAAASNNLRTIGTIGGAVVGGIFGGPAGAAAGAGVGSSIGGIISSNQTGEPIDSSDTQGLIQGGVAFSQNQQRQEQAALRQQEQQELQATQAGLNQRALAPLISSAEQELKASIAAREERRQGEFDPVREEAGASIQEQAAQKRLDSLKALNESKALGRISTKEFAAGLQVDSDRIQANSTLDTLSSQLVSAEEANEGNEDALKKIQAVRNGVQRVKSSRKATPASIEQFTKNVSTFLGGIAKPAKATGPAGGAHTVQFADGSGTLKGGIEGGRIFTQEGAANFAAEFNEVNKNEPDFIPVVVQKGAEAIKTQAPEVAETDTSVVIDGKRFVDDTGRVFFTPEEAETIKAGQGGELVVDPNKVNRQAISRETRKAVADEKARDTTTAELRTSPTGPLAVSPKVEVAAIGQVLTDADPFNEMRSDLDRVNKAIDVAKLPAFKPGKAAEKKEERRGIVRRATGAVDKYERSLKKLKGTTEDAQFVNEDEFENLSELGEGYLDIFSRSGENKTPSGWVEEKLSASAIKEARGLLERPESPTSGGEHSIDSLVETDKRLDQYLSTFGGNGSKDFKEFRKEIKTELAQARKQVASNRREASKSTLKQQETASGYRREMNKLTTRSRKVLDSYGSLKSLLNNTPSGTNDLAIIVSYLKIIDPPSVARESEQAAVGAATHYWERAKRWREANFGSTAEGQKLAQVQRMQIAGASASMALKAKFNIRDKRKMYAGFINEITPSKNKATQLQKLLGPSDLAGVLDLQKDIGKFGAYRGEIAEDGYMMPRSASDISSYDSGTLYRFKGKEFIK